MFRRSTQLAGLGWTMGSTYRIHATAEDDPGRAGFEVHNACTAGAVSQRVSVRGQFVPFSGFPWDVYRG